MATIGSLVVNVQLNNQQYLTQINQTTQATQRASQQMARSIGNIDRAFLLLRRTFLSFASIAVLRGAVSDVAAYSDAWREASNKIAAANSISTIQARSMEGIAKIASETRTGLAETADLYAKLQRAAEGVTTSEADVARVTEITNKAFRAGGASVQETVNGIRQLAQSLSSGIFQGDELRSIRENAPLLAKAIATEFNTTIGGLKKLGAEGKLTADRVFKAILDNAAPIDAAFAATNTTIADSFTNLNTAITKYVGTNETAVAASDSFIRGMKLLSDNFKTLADQVLSSNGAIGQFITLYNELRSIWERGTINQNKEQFKELGKAVAYLNNLFTDQGTAFGSVGEALSRLSHPFNAFLSQINLAVSGAIKLGKELGLIADIDPPTQKWSAFAKTIQPGQPLFKMPEFDATQFREAFKPDSKAIADLRNETMQSLANLGDLVEAARQGQVAFDGMEDKIAATNDVIKAGILPTSTLGQDYISLIMAVRAVTRELDGMINAIEGTEAAQRQVGQQKLLALALSISSEEYRKLKTHIDVLNEAESQNIDITSQQGQAWVTAQERAKAYEEELARLADRADQVADTINSTVSSAISSVASSFADAIVEGENFRDMLDSLLKDLAKLAINQVFQLFLKQMIGSVGTTGTQGSGLLGSVSLHGGGIVGSRVGGRSVPAAAFAGAPRLHGGGAFFGGAEFPAILKRGEGVFTEDQMKALGGGTQNNFTVINQVPNTQTTEERSRNASGGEDVTAYIRQTMTKEIGDPASSVHKQLKSQFGLSQAGVRR